MEERKKNPAAVSLGKRGAKARWSKLTPQERKDHGRKLTDARLAKRARAVLSDEDHTPDKDNHHV